ncbi:coiled-coil domain-containing protein 102A-like protein, partial [Euroglyphus maynei]
MNSYKKDALESKKQMFQMEKSISFWSDCTEYWRNKWRKTRDEKIKFRDEVKQLRTRINKLEHQLKTSEEKRIRLGNEVNFLNEELSRYMYRYEDDASVNRKKKPTSHQHPIQYNSDRRVDYRKKHRRKIQNMVANNPKSSTNQTQMIESSSSDSENQHFNNAQSHHSYTPVQQQQQQKHYDIDQMPSMDKLSSNAKIIFRHHERLFDKRITNKKRFSQVVMLDEDEIFQMNKDIPSSTISKTTNNDDTLKMSILQQSDLNDTLNSYMNKHRYMDYLPEDVEEEDSFDDRIKPGQFFNDDLELESTGIGSSNTNIVASTSNMAVNNDSSECFPK